MSKKLGSHSLSKNCSSVEIVSTATLRENGKPFLFCLMLIIINPEKKQENLREATLYEEGKELADIDPLVYFCISFCSIGIESLELNSFKTQNLAIKMHKKSIYQLIRNQIMKKDLMNSQLLLFSKK
jgi:hypothetical protein